MSSLRLMQLITERLVKTFQDIHEAITSEVNKMYTLEEPNQIQIPEHPEDTILKMVPSPTEKQKPAEEKNQARAQGSAQKVQKKIKKTTNLQKPKRPLSSFKLFLAQMKSQSQNRDDNQFQNMVTKLATKKWQSMNNEQKKPYQELQQKEVLEYEKNLQQFYSGNPQEKRRDLEKKEIKQQKKKQKLIQKKEEKSTQRQKNKSRQQQKNEKISDNVEYNPSSEEVARKEKKQKLMTTENSKKTIRQKSKVEDQSRKVNLGQQSEIDEQLESIIRISKREQNLQSQIQQGIQNRVIIHKTRQSQDEPSRRQIDQFLNLQQPSDSLGEDF